MNMIDRDRSPFRRPRFERDLFEHSLGEPTPESVYRRRREILKALGLAGVSVFAPGLVPRAFAQETAPPPRKVYPAKRAEKYLIDRALTEEQVAASHNNFYEFTTDKAMVREMVGKFVDHPWRVQVTGLVRKPLELDVDELIARMPLEERLYRHRCVEAWAMVVPWTGFPLSALLDLVEPKATATHVRFVSFLKPEEAPGQKADWYPWPYFEGLTLAEARNELTLIATGIYGHALPKQHGSPLRLVTPWKYGFKSIKSIVRIELVDQRPPTFWNQLEPTEYSFAANVDPSKPHPRWSQETETMIGTGERRPTLKWNGYGEYVAHLYS